MDATDRKILQYLLKNGREKASVISEQIQLSVSAVTERIKKLEASGIIEQYTVILNQRQLGYGVIALMEVSLEHPSFFDAFAEFVQQTPSIVSCYYMTGDYDFLIKVVTDSPDSLEEIHRKVKSFSGVSSTETHYVLKPLKMGTTDYLL